MQKEMPVWAVALLITLVGGLMAVWMFSSSGCVKKPGIVKGEVHKTDAAKYFFSAIVKTKVGSEKVRINTQSLALCKQFQELGSRYRKMGNARQVTKCEPIKLE